MKNRAVLVLATMIATAAIAQASQAPQSAPQQQQPAQAAPRQQAPVSPTQATNDDFVRQIMKEIAGHEQEPAEKVFKNIKLEFFKATPAARFLLIMNRGYSRALGVDCRHCHNENDFSSDEKRPKRAAREMAVMHRSINDQLNKMQNLEPRANGIFINCSTCHRGAVDPTASDR